MAKQTVEVSGVWLKGKGDKIEVLAEVNGEWLVIIPAESVAHTGEIQTVSHCVHPSGILNSKKAEF